MLLVEQHVRYGYIIH